MLKLPREIHRIVPKEIFAVLSGAFGYFGCFLFVAIASVSPREGQPGHTIATFLASFEVGAFFYLIYIHPMFVPVGWAGIFVLAYYHKRLAVSAAVTSCAIYAYFATAEELQRNISLADLQQGVGVYLDVKSSGFAVHTIPFIIYFGVLLALTLRKKPK